ncbi:hypothetical protein H5410_036257, partial [Solanum commersonii]
RHFRGSQGSDDKLKYSFRHLETVVHDKPTKAKTFDHHPLLRTLVRDISIDISMLGLINKATLSFAGMFWWAIVQSRLWPTLVDNTLTLYYVVFVVNIMVRYEIDFARYIIKELHKRALCDNRRILFPCFIYKFCEDFRVTSMPLVDRLT